MIPSRRNNKDLQGTVLARCRHLALVVRSGNVTQHRHLLISMGKFKIVNRISPIRDKHPRSTRTLVALIWTDDSRNVQRIMIMKLAAMLGLCNGHKDHGGKVPALPTTTTIESRVDLVTPIMPPTIGTLLTSFLNRMDVRSTWN